MVDSISDQPLPGPEAEQNAFEDHIALIFETAEERLAAITPLIKVGLEKGELCLYISNEENDRGIVEALKAENIDVEKAVGTGGLILTSKKEIYFKLGRFDPDWTIRVISNIADLAKSYGFTAMRIMSEMTWTQEPVPGVERWPEYEAKMNALDIGLSLRIICQYDRNAFPPEAMMVAIKTHPKVVSQGSVGKNNFYVPADRLLKGDYAALELERMLDSIRLSNHSESELQNRDALLEQMRAAVENSNAARKSIEMALEESRRRFSEFAERASDWVWELDKEGVYAYSSPRVKDILGLQPEEVLGRAPLDLVSQEEADRVSAILTRTMESRAPITALEKEMRHKDGHSVFLEMNGTPLFDREGNFLGYRGIDRDITGRKSAKLAIDESRRRAEESVAEVQARDQRIQGLEEAISQLRVAQADRDAALTSIKEAMKASQLDLDRAGEDLERLRDALLSREEEIVAAKALAETEQIEAEKRRASLTLLQQNLMDKEAELSLMRAGMEKAKAQHQEKETAMNELTASYKMQALELIAARGSLSGMEEGINRKEEELVTLRQQMDRMEAELRDAKQALVSKTEDLAQAQERMRQLTDALELNVGELTKASELSQAKDAALAGLQATQARLAEAEQALAQQLALAEQRRIDLKVMEGELAVARLSAAGTESDIGALQARLEQLRLDLIAQDAVVFGLREALGRRDGEISALRAEVKAAKEALLSSGAETLRLRDSMDLLASELCEVREALGIRDAELSIKREALSESNDRFQAIFQQAGAGIARISLDGRLLEANDKFFEMLGYETQDLAGKTFRDITHRDDLVESAQMYQRLVNGEVSSVSTMKRYIRKLGSTVWANVTMSPVRDPQGNLRYIMAIIDDRTDQMLAELALKEKEDRESEERYKNVIENAPEGVWVLDTEGRTTFVNQRVAAMLGYEPDELIGQPASKFMNSQWMERQENDPGSLGDEVRFIRRDGTDLWVMISSMPILDQSGQSKGAIGLVNDITALKAKEALAEASRAAALKEVARLRSLIGAISSPFAMVGPDGKVIMASPVLERLLGSGLEGRSISEMVPSLDLSAPFKAAVKVDGQEKEMLITPTPLAGGDGVVLTFAEVVRTEAAKGEVQGAPSDSLAHDLNDSLTVIMGSVSLAKEYVIPEGRMYTKLKQIESASVTARDLASRLMAPIKGSEPIIPEAPAPLIKGKGKVLLMDDDESILEATGDLLRYLGYAVDVARDGEEALAMCKEARDAKQPFELAILDLEISSGMGGKEAGQKLRAEHPALKLIISSGYTNDLALAEPLSMGFAAAIPKPYAAEALSRIVASVLASRA